ncbi:PfkB family carbohydrate kinase [Pseudomonas mangiferae]|uniref:Ribokinase n=1 Tax=Pseudomonas mangiferae TaxID=2593654 RepID=A0A553GVX8_9PSED|nr:PfkB family carbohydrate kinase [Pseudomonas mangiferae]TRX73657.1 ribokinase [Pseudomonas mangiferae]
MPGTLLSLGSINADFQVRVEAAPGSQETLLAHDFRRLPGGKAANTAYLGARFGHRSLLLGRVGDDELAEQALAPLRQAGVDVSGVSQAAGAATAVSMIMVPPDAKKVIVLANNANDQWDEAACARALARLDDLQGPACLVLDYEVPAWVVRRALDRAARIGIAVVLDPSFPERLEHDLLPRMGALTPNVEEAAALLGERLDSLERIAQGARRLGDAGVDIVCIKLADGGCVVVEEGRATLIPPREVEPVDTTGAGDAFTGTFAIARLEGRAPLEAAAWGVAASSLAVTAYGSQGAYAGRDQVEPLARERLHQARRLA